MRDAVSCTNNPYKGTGHLSDLVVTTPAFHRGRLVGVFSCTSHIGDLGGIGFGPDGTDVFMEGIHLPFLKLVDRKQGVASTFVFGLGSGALQGLLVGLGLPMTLVPPQHWSTRPAAVSSTWCDS